MPDYSKTIIYKIQHEDNEELVYVVSTTDFTKRKCRHKYISNKPNDKFHNLKIYKMIDDNGGWSCFKMVQIKEFPCNNKREAQLEEDHIMLELKANMNDRRASRSRKEWRNDNKEQLAQKDKQYYKNNQEKLKEQNKDYSENNKEQIAKYQKEYQKNITKKTKNKYYNNETKK